MVESLNRSALFSRASSVIPGGVNSPVRAWKSVGGTPAFVASAKGSRIVDTEGVERVDFCGSWGPMIVGHARDEVVEAVCRAAARGTSYGAPTLAEIEMAETLRDAVPSIEEVRLVSSGTEATMSAIRLARGFTGKSRILKFEGCYHGHVDSLLVRAGSGLATLGTPDSAGVPEAFTRLTHVAAFNDRDAVDEAVAAAEGDLAAIIVEPVAGNMGVVPPEPGFLEHLREVSRRTGSLLVFDEVITGFRVGRGGAQERFGVVPDLTCLGKIIGGGLPVGAFGGRADVMRQLAPGGPVYQAGTLSGNPLAVTAGLATLALLTDDAYARLEALSQRLGNGVRRALEATGTRAAFQRVGSMWTLFLGVDGARSFAEVKAADAGKYARVFHGMADRGYVLPPSAFETAFVSLAHTDEEIDGFTAALEEVLGVS